MSDTNNYDGMFAVHLEERCEPSRIVDTLVEVFGLPPTAIEELGHTTENGQL